MNEDYEILGPQKPEAAINKRRAAQRIAENEDKKIKEWREFKLKLTEKAGIILGYLLKALSKDINIWIENTYPDINTDPTIAIIKEILTGVRNQFGGYSHNKSQASESRLNSIPKFTTSKSVVIGINTINTLNYGKFRGVDLIVGFVTIAALDLGCLLIDHSLLNVICYFSNSN